jgi:hypothetical protein
VRRVEVIDYIILAPRQGQREISQERLRELAMEQIMAQYRGQHPPIIELQPIEWLVTQDPEDVERHQPAHDCADCKAGNERAQRYLRMNPGAWLWLGNLFYTEIWDE